MELVNGGDLFDYIVSKGKLSTFKLCCVFEKVDTITLGEDLTADFTAQLCDAMAVCIWTLQDRTLLMLPSTFIAKESPIGISNQR